MQVIENIESSWKSPKYVVYGSSLEMLGISVGKHQDWFDGHNTDVNWFFYQ